MSRSLKKFKQNRPLALIHKGKVATKSVVFSPLLPMGAILLAGSMSALAQEATSAYDKTLKPVVVKEKAEVPEGRDAVRATQTTIAKGVQQLRDIPQSVTVVTERLIDERHLDSSVVMMKKGA